MEVKPQTNQSIVGSVQAGHHQPDAAASVHAPSLEIAPAMPVSEGPAPHVARTPVAPFHADKSVLVGKSGELGVAGGAVPGYADKKLQELHDARHEKKGARRVFHLVNFLGLHQIFNNVASVVITYFMVTTNLADSMKDKMASTAIGKGLSYVLSLPGRVVNGGFRLCGVDLNKELKALPEAERLAETAFRSAKSQRSAIETGFMCVAGFVALFPVYYLENHRAGFLNKVDNWLHPGRSKEEKEAAALGPGEESKETWWSLIRARFIALAVVFGIDQARDNIDSILKHKGKPNVDTVFGWGLGNKVYDALPEGPRSWLARFFSGSLKGNNISLSGIQHEVREDVLKITGAPPALYEASKKITELGKQIITNGENKSLKDGLKLQIKAIEDGLKTAGHTPAIERAVFAEQSRLFLTKEVFLTTILSVVIYTVTKAPFMARFFEKVGLKKKEHEAPDAAVAAPAAALRSEEVSAPGEAKHAVHEEAPAPKGFADKTAPKTPERAAAQDNSWVSRQHDLVSAAALSIA